jgi:V/A-type H+-transporting ATPase subunit C
MSGASSYAAINARVRAMYSDRISAEKWNALEETTDLRGFTAGLADTPYGPYLGRVPAENLTPRRTAYQIQGRIADIYTTIIRLSNGPSRTVIRQTYRHFETDNVKAVLRGVENGAAWTQVQFVLFPYGEEAVLPGEQMSQAGDIRSAVEKLRGTPYYPTLDHAMARYNTEGSNFPLEVALDLAYWRTLWNAVHQLSGQDREQSVRIIGTRMDVTNLLWAIRYRVYHGLSEEEIINYTLPFGFQVRDEDIRSIAAGADIGRIATRIYPNMTDVEELLESPRSGLPILEIRLLRHVADQCRAVLAGYPFHLGIPLGFAMLSEMEARDLIVLVESKSLQTPPETYRPYLLLHREELQAA